ncbi:DUF3526 domain-containing protein [Flagellimonas hymeniacidonis]|uniref:DUF3526 domain-containing protein n=1 Tax=Flagellimonas hymeniacidonis TaxID=2603628 RepID=A0A5C8V504_9FLAO|nr:DUF3526 domain-containing protein [Flagellimonas hymeniacidonis]TXN35828.1 DUF3526 domain-containing protein [Flagellimonas hymeniacidonis]
MYKYNFLYELKLLLRSGWMQILSLLLLGLFCFATINGDQKVKKRKQDIHLAKAEVKESDANMLSLLDSIENGMEVSASRWTIPSSPTAVGNYHPRVAAMDSQPLSFVSTGQSDLFTHYVKPTMTGDDFTLNFTEIISPVQQLFGSFDLAFVIVYLLPLIIIAFSYNILSAERESGSLKLLASQPILIHTWVFQKISLRFFWTLILTAIILTIVFLFLASGSNFNGLFNVIIITTAYILFWFALAFVVNLRVGNSSKNAIVLLGLWVVFVLLVPSVINQLGNTLYPMPSRTLMINKMRSLKEEAIEKQDEILDNFLRDHPEYAINDPNQNRKFYHRYLASQKLVKEELEPVALEFEQQLERQQALISKFRWLSPSIIAQESLNMLSGTSTADYEDYRKQVIRFAEIWRDHLTPLLYNNEPFTSNDYPELPSFNYQPIKLQNNIVSSLIIMMVSIGIGCIGYIVALRGNASKLIVS